MTDDFLMVTGNEWFEVPDVESHILQNIGEATLNGMIDDSDWPGIFLAMQDFLTIPEGQQLVGARLIHADMLRFWVKLV